MASNLGIITAREYSERVKRKSFIITTIAVPLGIMLMMALPGLMIAFGQPERKVVQVVDNSGLVGHNLEGNDEILFRAATAAVDSLRSDSDVEAILVINSDAVNDPRRGAVLMSRGSLSLTTTGYIRSQLNRAIEDARLEALDIPDARKILSEIKADVGLTTVRIDTAEDSETSSELSYLLSMGMDMLLYMVIIIYGQMVMNSIIEEKSSRVLEVVVSSVRPFDLMMGKIAGVGLVALTQMLIWVVLIGMAMLAATPFLTPEYLGNDMEPELQGMISQFTDPMFLLELTVCTLLYFIGGFLFYASIYAAIGSAVSNVQDASQLTAIATLPIVIGIVGTIAIMQNPGSTLAVWFSIIPFFSPMTMMARIPYGVASWQIILSLGLLYASFIFMIWGCAKIYRIGIFMHGKKPTLADLLKWARYD